MRRRLPALLLCGLLAASASAIDGNETGEQQLPERFARWLEEVAPLITRAERKLFESLQKDYQREAFIEGFWKVRDPYLRTARNELKERWPERIAKAKNNFGTLTDDRSRILLIHGPPASGFRVSCTRTRQPAEVWVYNGSEQLDRPFILVFIRYRGEGEARIWRPDGSGVFDQEAARIRSCINGARLTSVLGTIRAHPNEYLSLLRRVLAKPKPRSEEWVYTFSAFSTDLPPAAESLAGALELAFPGRHQHRTVVQGLLTVPAEQASAAEFAGFHSYDFQLTGEVIRDHSLFERFRYKFGFPAEEIPATATIPLAFQRYLRPGDYTLILKLDDLNSDRVYRVERRLQVPATEELIELPRFEDPLTEQLFAEATEAIAMGETSVRLIPPRGDLQTGFVRFDTLVAGDEIRKVRFYLDDKLVLTKNRPPYNVAIDLGAYPDLHALRAEALDAEGGEVASDEILINSGSHRFLVKLREPRRGRRYTRSLRARAEIEVPEGRSLERVEFYLNENLAATLYQEPWVHPIILPDDAEVAYVRAVAYLPDGNSTEDLAFINAPDYMEELEVQFVELYTTVLDRRGRPVEGLGEEEFRVLENDLEQSIVRFETVADQPIHVGILIDNSASMVGTLDEVRKAALSFFQQAITAKDRAAVITFNSFPNLVVELTNERTALGAGLAGLVAEGQTALFDSVMFALYYFTGIKGQRAILVLSDGKDESSRFKFDETLEYARRAGITVYVIGFRLGDGDARWKLRNLADETGGRSFFISSITELEEIYGVIQRELRSQYLIAYQSSNTADDGEFRTIDLKLDRPGVTVKTLSGYYP
ncbi:MAG: VWA domain-containing protein [bacterium]|nr:VWA domain-containing protein [bacterium]